MVKVLLLQRSLFLEKLMLWNRLATVYCHLYSDTNHIGSQQKEFEVKIIWGMYAVSSGGNEPKVLFCFNKDIMFLHFKLKHGRNYWRRQLKISESNPFQIWYGAMIVFLKKRCTVEILLFYVLIHRPNWMIILADSGTDFFSGWLLCGFLW